MKRDIYKLEQRYRNWKAEVTQEGVPGLEKPNSAILIQYVLDMEVGRNTARGSRKGGRSYSRLVTLQQRLKQLFKLLQHRGIRDVRSLTDTHVTDLFAEMERGAIKTTRGTPFQSTTDYIRDLKSFWHWWMKVNRRSGVQVPDVTDDLSGRRGHPKFVYLRKEDVEALLPYFTDDQQVLLLFLFDSVIRAPTEVLSLRVQDVFEQDDEVWVHVPDSVSKTFGRTFNLLYCGDAVLNYITRTRLRPGDYLFEFSPPVLNRKLKEAARSVFGDRVSHAQGDLYKNLSLYDFRHSGAIHLRLLAKDNPGQISLDAIRHRAGWTELTMLNYYTRFIGLDGKIEKQGMLLKQDKHRLERELEVLRNQLERIRMENERFREAVSNVVQLPTSQSVRQTGKRSNTICTSSPHGR